MRVVAPGFERVVAGFDGIETWRDVKTKELFRAMTIERPVLSTAEALRAMEEIEGLTMVVSPSLARVYKMIRPGADMKRAVVVTEQCFRGSLARAIEEKSLGATAQNVAIMSMIHGLADAHSRKLLIRDLDPSNVQLSEEGMAKLPLIGQTLVCTLKGTVCEFGGFSAPELQKGGEATAASDVWSLGATIFALLAGEQSFDIGRSGTIPSGAVGALPGLLSACLKEDPRQRPGAADIVSRLESEGWLVVSGASASQVKASLGWFAPSGPGPAVPRSGAAGDAARLCIDLTSDENALIASDFERFQELIAEAHRTSPVHAGLSGQPSRGKWQPIFNKIMKVVHFTCPPLGVLEQSSFRGFALAAIVGSDSSWFRGQKAFVLAEVTRYVLWGCRSVLLLLNDEPSEAVDSGKRVIAGLGTRPEGADWTQTLEWYKENGGNVGVQVVSAKRPDDYLNSLIAYFAVKATDATITDGVLLYRNHQDLVRRALETPKGGLMYSGNLVSCLSPMVKAKKRVRADLECCDIEDYCDELATGLAEANVHKVAVVVCGSSKRGRPSYTSKIVVKDATMGSERTYAVYGGSRSRAWSRYSTYYAQADDTFGSAHLDQLGFSGFTDLVSSGDDVLVSSMVPLGAKPRERWMDEAGVPVGPELPPGALKEDRILFVHDAYLMEGCAGVTVAGVLVKLSTDLLAALEAVYASPVVLDKAQPVFGPVLARLLSEHADWFDDGRRSDQVSGCGIELRNWIESRFYRGYRHREFLHALDGQLGVRMSVDDVKEEVRKIAGELNTPIE